MKRPKRITDTPRNDWQYKQPETGMPFKEQHYNTLQCKVWEHRSSLPELNMDVSGGWEVRLWNDVCLQNQHVECEEVSDPGKTLGMGDIFRFLRNMAEWIKGGMQLVHEQEAERRASLCTSGAGGLPCPYNKSLKHCWGCHGAGKLLDEAVGNRRTSVDATLESCTYCSCTLKAKVWLPNEAIQVDHPENTPSFCWLKKENQL